jgi:hypothetical protein
MDSYASDRIIHAGSNAWILCGDKSASKALRMKVGRKYPVTLGGVDCRVLRYEILPPRPHSEVENVETASPATIARTEETYRGAKQWQDQRQAGDGVLLKDLDARSAHRV